MATRILCRALVIVWAALAALPARAAPVDLQLVLAVDCSGSVDADEFALQIRGYAQALTHPTVIRAIQAGSLGAIAVTYVQWSGPSIQNQAVGWTRISDAKSAETFAAAMIAAPRRIYGGGTSLSGIIDHARKLFDGGGFEAARRTIDISGDGTNNSGRAASDARDDAVAEGLTINGLPILTDFARLDDYFRDNVIGGPGAFVIPAESFESFAAAILNKLVREIAAAPGDQAAPPASATTTRRLRLPLFSIFSTTTGPISPVARTCVPPQGCRSTAGPISSRRTRPCPVGGLTDIVRTSCG
jgi:Protein of unknown function (DUF1194)